MERIDIDHEELTLALLAVPSRVVAGLLSADLGWREQAAEGMALTVIQQLGPPLRPDPNQLPLPL